MAAKLNISRRKRGAEDDLDLEGLQAPPAVQQSDQLQMPQAPQAATQPTSLAKHEILDRISMGGMSALELQNVLRTNVFLTDEDRAAYMARAGAGNHAAIREFSAPPHDVFASASTPAAAPHSAPLGGPEALGAEGAKAPQGLMAPQGFLTVVGMIGFVKGLLGVRSDMPQPSQSQAQSQSQNSSSAAQNQSAKSSAAGETQMTAPARPTASTASSPEAGQASQGMNTRAEQPGPALSQMTPRDSSLESPSTGQNSTAAGLSQPPQETHPFQPASSEPSWLSQAMWGKTNSPFIEVINQFFSLLRKLVGLDRPGGPPPSVRRGGH